jgi:divalent metal cation (Fe/Co/Zn/Cd) transporter
MNNLLNTTYLFDLNPGVSQYQNTQLIVVLVMILVSVLVLWLVKKRREFLKINKAQRFSIRKHVLVDAILSGVLLVFMFFRLLSISFLSMRFIQILLLVSIVVVALIGLIETIRNRDVQEIKSETAEQYSKYLPKKKKK